MATDYLQRGLDAAASKLADAMKRVAAAKTRRAADAVRITHEDGDTVIAAGKPEGVYGWDPITALMFEDDRRHPLFGDKKHWYPQGHYPITELTERAALDDAVDAFADAAVPPLLKEYGFEDD